MLVFIDESGCAGFKFDRGSTPYFVAAMVVFNDHDEANRVDAAIDELRKPTRHKTEFKFSSCSDDVRDCFFQGIRAYDFIIRAIVVNKERLYSAHLRDRQPFYNYFVQLMMQYDNGLLDDAIVKIDGSGDREFKRELQKYLKRQLGSRVKKVRPEKSHNNNLIQLVDMCAGAIHRRYRDDRRDRNRWYNMLRGRIHDIWTFPNPGY